MKNVGMFVLCIVLIAPVIISCAGNAGVQGVRAASGDGNMTFDDVTGKYWALTEIRRAGNTIQINRRQLEANNIGDFFTINFQDNRVSGIGAPNRYFGPYSLGRGQELSFGNLASTLMAAFIEADELKEHEYYAYLNNVTRWNIRDGKLELYSSTSAGAELILVFTEN
jgi:heat shock protein HslJ